MAKMSRQERAKQFMPFAALTGYYDIIKECEIIPSQRKELLEEQAQKLNDIITQLKKGDYVLITYYKQNGYAKLRGTVTFIDKALGKISVIKTAINFADIYDITLNP